MIEPAKFHLLISDSPLKKELRQALLMQGFSLHAQSSVATVDLETVLDSDVLVLDRKSFLSLLKNPAGSAIRAGPLTLYPASFEAVCAGQTLSLTTSEFQLLQVLCENRPRAISRQKLVEIFAQMGFELSLRTIDNHIFNLRKKLAGHQDIIGTIRGIGYKVSAI